MRDKIYGVLEDIYNPKNDVFTSELNRAIASRIAQKIYEARSLHQEVINEIWMSHAGGGTAQIAADKIFATLKAYGYYESL